jgi:hypothetical protein
MLEILLSKAVTLFENDERFKAVERERDRKDLIETYLQELEEKVNFASFIFLSSIYNIHPNNLVHY